MTNEYGTGYAGLPVAVVDGETGPDGLPPVASAAWKVATRWDGARFGDVFGRFLEYVDTTRVSALVIGFWELDDGSEDVDPVDLLVEAAGLLPNLRALFLGDMESEEKEISWIDHSDVSPLFGAFPRLERLDVRGDLSWSPVRSDALKMLRVESGGLSGEAVQGLAASELPSLEHLELWLGVEEYGGTATLPDLAPILGGARLPALRHLGLQNSPLQDEIAAAVAGAPVTARLESLSLSMGTLSDEGAEALLSGRPLTHLNRLDLDHNFLSPEMAERMRAALEGVDVEIGSVGDHFGDEPYVEVSE